MTTFGEEVQLDLKKLGLLSKKLLKTLKNFQKTSKKSFILKQIMIKILKS
jgi:hypothetical protein